MIDARKHTLDSVKKLTDYSDFNLYKMDICYDYSIDKIIDRGIFDDESALGAILQEILPVIATTLAIRLILDRASSTEEAVKLFEKYDMFASSGRDYHFYVTDSNGDGRVIEYDCNSDDRKLVVTKSPAVTNFFVMYKNFVKPYQKNDVYGHGRERYDKIINVLEKNNSYTKETAWEALVSASQAPNPNDITSNTQWSIVYNNTNLTADISIRRDWNTVTKYSLKENKITK
jgi:predicted choloylglycine hydrolase